MTNMDTIGTYKKVPLSVKECNRFGSSCSFCKQNVLYHSPQESDWLAKDWTGAHKSPQKETGETNLLSDWDFMNPNPKPTQSWRQTN